MITQDELKHKLHYNPDTGIFTWINPIKKTNIGKVAGCTMANGYSYIKINKKLYLSHRLAWIYINGEVTKELDHINNNRSDNKISNLRIASKFQNQCNKKVNKNNIYGIKGITLHSKCNKFQARIGLNNKTIYVGLYDDFFEACCSIISVRNKLHGKFFKNA